MKLKFLCMFLSGTGGTETVLVKVLNELCHQNEIELILTNRPQEDTWLKKLDPKIKLSIYEGKFKRLSRIAWTFLTASKDTYFISLSPKMIKLGARLRQLFHKRYKLISWIHFSLNEQNMFDAQTTLPLADGHLAINSVIKEQLISYGIAQETIFLIHNPIEPVVKALKPSTKPKSFFYAGRITFLGQKNLKELLDALALVEDATLDVYGTGEDLEKCQTYAASLGIAERITWHGFTAELWEQIKVRPSALILTSTFEGLPMIALETAAHGIPIICSNFNGYRDILQEDRNGFSYQLHNIEQLAQKMNMIDQVAFTPEQIKSSIQAFYPQTYFKNFEKALHKLK